MTASEITPTDLCRACGACCMDVAAAPVTLNDIQRLMTDFNLTFEQAKKMTWSEQNEVFILVAESGACPALSGNAEDGYSCGIYHSRPDICRHFECVVLNDLKDWLKSASRPNNSFWLCGSHQEAWERAHILIRNYKSFLHWHYTTPQNGQPQELPAYFDKLCRALEGGEIEQTFPEAL